ncbi:hypothetical protein ACOMHN_000426 [Nucella lapillus]
MALLKVCPHRTKPPSRGVQPICKHPCSSCKSPRPITGGAGGWYPMVRRLLLGWCLVWTWISTPVLTITLPVTMPAASHPSDYLTVVSKDSGGQSSAKSSLSPMDISKVREEEVLYHLYKNGPVGSRYQRRASTVFLVDLFNDLVQGRPPGRAGRHGPGRAGKQTGKGEEEFPLTDTIRSFSAAEVTRKPSQKTAVHFAMPYLPPNERLESAELRFLHQFRTSRARTKSRYKLGLVISRGGRVVQRAVLKERAMLQQEYHVFDVSKVMQSWINTHHGNITLQVRLPRRLVNSLQLRNSSLESTSLIALYLKDRDFLRNMYESYTTDDSRIQSNYIPDNTDDPTDSKASDPHTLTRHRRESAPASRDKRVFGRRKSKNRKNKRWYRAPKHAKCGMYDFKVDFDFIGWGQWIIHPKDFNSKFCYGSCRSPVESKVRPTNHAMLQTLMRQKKARLAPPTCCVPTELKPLSMLYFEYGEIVVRHHEDMIADECGCR